MSNILNGLLLGLGGAGQAVTNEREEQRQRELRSLALLLEQRRQDAVVKEAEARRLQEAEQFKTTDARVREMAMLPYEQQRASEIARAQEAKQRAGAIAGELESAAWDGGSADTGPANPILLKLAGLARAGAPASELKSLREMLSPQAATPEKDKPFVVGADQSLVDARGNPLYTGPGKPDKEPRNRQYHVETNEGIFSITEDAHGNEVSRRRIGAGKPNQPAQPSGSTIYAQAVDALEQAEAKYPPGHPERVKAETRVSRLKPMSVAEGGFIAGPGGQNPLVTAPAKPVSDATAKDIAGIEQASKAGARLSAALKDPAKRATLDQYLGPADQLRYDVQKNTPNAMLGEVPLAASDMRQDLEILNGYIRRLNAGLAQTGIEMKNVWQQQATTDYRLPVFEQRLNRSLENAREMESTLKSLALRGNRRAQEVVRELGLEQGGAGVGGGGAGWSIKRVR